MVLTRRGFDRWWRIRRAFVGGSAEWRQAASDRIRSYYGDESAVLGDSTLERILRDDAVDRGSLDKAFIAVGVDPGKLRLGLHFVPRCPEPSSRRVGNVAPPARTTVGRVKEIAELAWAIDHYQFVEMCGPPGIGKTHLAREVGSRLAGIDCARFPGGVHWLSAATDSAVEPWASLAQACQEALETAGDRGKVLCIVDVRNHPANRAALDVLGRLKSAGAAGLFIGTESLGVDHAFSLGPLETVGPVSVENLEAHAGVIARSESGRLFLQEVRTLLPYFSITSDVAIEVEHVLRPCQGNPGRIMAEAHRTALRLTPSMGTRAETESSYISRPEVEGTILQSIRQKLIEGPSTPAVLISIEGDGGMGKTRLAYRVRKRLDLPISCLNTVVDLTSISPSDGDGHHGEALLRELASALAILAGPDGGSKVLDVVGDRSGLLILDNLESLHGPSLLPTIERLQNRCRGLAILCTTRISLGAAESQRVDLNQGMLAGEAIQLLRRRWREAWPPDDPMVDLSHEEATTIVDLCDRIPLALEMVANAARSQTSPSELAEELRELHQRARHSDEFLGRFKLESEAKVARHASLEGSIRWTHRHLMDRVPDIVAYALSIALPGLGAFAGPFGNEDFAAVAGEEALLALPTLRAAHFIDYDPVEGQWRQHVFLRAYCASLLRSEPCAEEIWSRFEDHYWRGFIESSPKLGLRDGDGGATAKSQANWQAAGFRLLGKAKAGDRAAADLFRSGCAAILNYIWFSAWDARPLIRDAVATFESLGDQATLGEVEFALGMWYDRRREKGLAHDAYERAAAQFAVCGLRVREANALRCLCAHDQDLDRMRRALELCGEEDRFVRALCLYQLAQMSIESSPDEAERLFREAAEIHRSLDFHGNVGHCLIGLAVLAARRNDRDGECALLAEALSRFHTAGDEYSCLGGVLHLAGEALSLARLNRDARWRARALQLLAQFGTMQSASAWPHFAAEYEKLVFLANNLELDSFL